MKIENWVVSMMIAS